MRSDYLRHRSALNKQLGIVNNRFFGDDDWLDLVGTYLGLQETTGPEPLGHIVVDDMDAEYREYLEWLPVVEKGASLFREVVIPAHVAPLSPWWHIEEPGPAFDNLRQWVDNTSQLIGSYKQDVSRYGDDFTDIKGATALKVRWLSWAVPGFRQAGTAQRSFLQQYEGIFPPGCKSPSLRATWLFRVMFVHWLNWPPPGRDSGGTQAGIGTVAYPPCLL